MSGRMLYCHGKTVKGKKLARIGGTRRSVVHVYIYLYICSVLQLHPLRCYLLLPAMLVHMTHMHLDRVKLSNWPTNKTPAPHWSFCGITSSIHLSRAWVLGFLWFQLLQDYFVLCCIFRWIKSKFFFILISLLLRRTNFQYFNIIMKSDIEFRRTRLQWYDY